MSGSSTVMLRNPRYVIAVNDLERSARFHRDVLGFEIRAVGDPGWRFFVLDQCFIMAGECKDALSPGELGDHSYFAYLDVEGIDALYEDLRARNADVIKPLRDEPWGMREFGIRTVDGHRIMFGCRLVGQHE
jgi:predicted enzyme related to lactoylglutathione lyase